MTCEHSSVVTRRQLSKLLELISIYYCSTFIDPYTQIDLVLSRAIEVYIHLQTLHRGRHARQYFSVGQIPPSSSFPSPLPPLPFYLSFFSLSLNLLSSLSMTLTFIGRLGSAVSSPSGVRGGGRRRSVSGERIRCIALKSAWHLVSPVF